METVMYIKDFTDHVKARAERNRKWEALVAIMGELYEVWGYQDIIGALHEYADRAELAKDTDDSDYNNPQTGQADEINREKGYD